MNPLTRKPKTASKSSDTVGYIYPSCGLPAVSEHALPHEPADEKTENRFQAFDRTSKPLVPPAARLLRRRCQWGSNFLLASGMVHHSSFDLWMYLTCNPRACSVSKLWLHSGHCQAFPSAFGAARVAIGHSGKRGFSGTGGTGGAMSPQATTVFTPVRERALPIKCLCET